METKIFSQTAFVLHFGTTVFHGRESQFHGRDQIEEERTFHERIGFIPLSLFHVYRTRLYEFERDAILSTISLSFLLLGRDHLTMLILTINF
jgi:hypothetical protein